MPTGRVKWYDADKGFGFLAQDGGEDVYVPQGARCRPGWRRSSPASASSSAWPRAAAGRRRCQVRLVDPPPSVVEATRRSPDELHGLIEDMIKVLEARVQPDLRRGRYPDRRHTKQLAEVVRAVARELEG